MTRVRVTSQVILPGVTRLGINLGEQNYYDSGQMTRNLLFRNPGFEGMAYRSILHCLSAGPASCVDTRQSFQWPAGFWDGASFEVLDGVAAGRRGTVKASGPNGGGFSLTLNGGGAAVGAGDWLAVEKQFPGDPASGWWPSLNGGAHLEAERRDLSPATQGHQALRIEAAGAGQSVDLKSYFDSTEGLTFVRLRGRYRLSFRAKALAGAKTLHIHIGRIANGVRRYLDQDVQLTHEWADYHADFSANEDAGPAGPVETGFTVTGGSLLLDDVDFERTGGEQTGGDPGNHTAFRDEVVRTLRDLRPGVLRLMSSHAELGSTVDNLLQPPPARLRSGYSTWSTMIEDIPVGVPEFLELCREVGAEPWIVAPTAMSGDEARELAEYLVGGVGTAGGKLRASEGRLEPWSRAFPTIHIELGNETWNGIFQGETLEDPAAYGRHASRVFTAFRAAAGADAGRFDLVVGAFTVVPYRNTALLAAVPQANSLAIAPYLMHSVTRWGNDDELYGPLLAQPEQMSRAGVVQGAQASAGGRQLAVYEVNLHTTEGNAPQAVLDRFTPSAAAGVAVTGHMLRMMRDHGIRNQMLFSLPQYNFRRGDGTLVKLWGSVVEMGGRSRPQLLAEELANRVVRGDMVRVEMTGEDPTHDQPEGNDGVKLNAVHELDAYGFQQGKWHGLILFNYGLHQSRRIRLEGPGLAETGLAGRAGVSLARLVSAGPGSTNENAVQVTVTEERLSEPSLSMPPCSIVVLQWQE